MMRTITAYIERHPVLSYYVLTFAISWGGVLWVVGGPSAISSTPEDLMPLFPAMLLAALGGPSLAGVLLTGLVGGKAGFRDLLERMLRWRVGARWYAVALLTAPLSVLATLLALSRLSPEYLPGFLVTTNQSSAPGDPTTSFNFAVVVVAGVVTGFLEEIGWTGFAIPRLKRRHGVFSTGLSVGLLWGAWHFMSNVLGSGTSSEGVPLALFLTVVLFSFLPPYRVLMVWVYDRTESLLVAMLMHASLVVFWLLATPPGIAGAPMVVWYLAWAVLLWAVIAVVAVATHGQLVRPPVRMRVA